MKGKIAKSIIALVLFVLLAIIFIRNADCFSSNEHLAIYSLITLFLAIVALFGQKWLAWLVAPSIKIDFKNSNPYLVNFKNNIHIRISVKNTGQSTAKALICRIEKVYDLDEDKLVLEGFEKVLLPWVGFPYPVIERRILNPNEDGLLISDFDWIKNDIPRNMESYADVAVIDYRGQGIRLETGIRWPTQFILANKIYKNIRITLAVYGENLNPVTQDVELKFDDIKDAAISQSIDME
jgi:hypothetical protein